MLKQKAGRILHTADLHHGVSLGGHSRLAEQLARLEDMVAIAIQESVDVFVIAGDLFYENMSWRMASHVAKRTIDALLPLAQSGIPILTITGNHDHVEWFDMMESMSRLAVARAGAAGLHGAPPLVIRKDAGLVTLQGIQFVCLPYPAREVVAHAVGHSTDKEGDPRVERNRAVADGVSQILGKIVRSPQFNPSLPTVLVAHFTMANASTPSQEEGFLYDWDGDFALSAADIPTGVFAYGAFGHIHMPQDLHKTKHAALPFPSRYSGSPCRLNMGERDDEKSVTLVDIFSDNTAECWTVPLEQTPMYAIDCSVEELDKYRQDSHKYANAYVRVHLHHDGTVPKYRLRRMIREIFPMYTELKLIGPELRIASARDRIALVSHDGKGDGSNRVKWNPEEHLDTVDKYLAERLAGQDDEAELRRLAAGIAVDVKQRLYGGLEEESEGAEDVSEDDSSGSEEAA